MSSILFLVIMFIFFGLVFAGIAFYAYRRALRRAKGIERGLKMIPLLIHLPPPAGDQSNESRDARQVLQEKISQAEVLYDLISGTAQQGFKSSFYGQRHIAMEIVASRGLIHYFVAVPVAMVSVVEQAILTAYPGARLEEVEDHNIFNPQGKLTGTAGGELVLKHQSAFPISTYKHIERDPMEALLNAMSKLQQGDGASVQIMIRPARKNWTRAGISLVAKKRKTKSGSLSFTPGDFARAAYKSPSVEHQENQVYKPSKLEESVLEQIEEKTRYPGYEVLIRLIVSSPEYDRSQMLLRNITNAFSLFEAPGMNGFQFYPARDIEGLVTAFIFRFFPPELSSNILNSPELATIFHLPDSQYTPTSQLQRQTSKQVDGPVQTSANGLLMGYNIYRGTKKEIRLSPEDRRRHTYIVGQTGTGKSTILENLAVQDMLAGNGFAFIDPHGDAAEKLISMVPKERAEDIIYFNPSDMERPLGINLFEFSDPTQKDFLINEAINMIYKIYDPGKTGIVGPRFEHWFRNAALTLMADPAGASFIEIPKVFTDSNYLKNKFKYLTDPTVIDFWTKEMGQTSDYHKSEMLGWFVSKFGAFMTNDLMRNILGQTKSSFDLRQIMDNKKILIVNLSKGKLGDVNAQYLGMIFVIKFQAAAMSRANVEESQRPDFCLYVDEFQNYSTDSFASILSEARKYHLNLIVANQFIGQLSDEIRDAVFGNVGTIMSYRCGPEDAEFLVKQFAPIFDQRDLVGLPNFNAVMRLMMGGLPSRPFSVTAMPPLGIAHQEMGLAVKQLSAAKFGLPRAKVEADIFARLQSKPSVAPSAEPEQAPAVVQAKPSTPVSEPVTASQIAPSAPVSATPAATKPSEDIASVVGPINIPASSPKPAPVVAAPASVQGAATGVAVQGGQTPNAQPPASTPDSNTPIAAQISSGTANATEGVMQTAAAQPSAAPASSSTNSSPAPALPVQPLSTSASLMHDQVQDEINELASEAMHVSAEQAGETNYETPDSELTPEVESNEKSESLQSVTNSPKQNHDSNLSSTSSAGTESALIFDNQKPVAKEPINNPQVINDAETSKPSSSTKELALEAPDELMLPEHAGVRPPKLGQNPSKTVSVPKPAESHKVDSGVGETPKKPAPAPAQPNILQAPKNSLPKNNVSAPVSAASPPGRAAIVETVKAPADEADMQSQPTPTPTPTPTPEPLKGDNAAAANPNNPSVEELAQKALQQAEEKLETVNTAAVQVPPSILATPSPGENDVKNVVGSTNSPQVGSVEAVQNGDTKEASDSAVAEAALKPGEIRVDDDGNVIMG